MRDRLNVSLPVEMIARINELAAQKRLTRSAIVEAAVASFCRRTARIAWRPRSRAGSTD